MNELRIIIPSTDMGVMDNNNICTTFKSIDLNKSNSKKFTLKNSIIKYENFFINAFK